MYVTNWHVCCQLHYRNNRKNWWSPFRVEVSYAFRGRVFVLPYV